MKKSLALLFSKIFYLSLFICSPIFSSHDESESITRHIRPLYAANRYKAQWEMLYQDQEEIYENKTTSKNKNILGNILTTEDLKSAGKQALLDYFYQNHNNLARCSLYLMLGKGTLNSKLYISEQHYDIEDPIIQIPKNFILGLSQAKIDQANQYLNRRIPAAATHKINYLSPVVTQQDILDVTGASAQATIKRMVTDRKFDSKRIKKTVTKAIATQYIYNKAKMGVTALNQKFNLCDPQIIQAVEPIINPLLYFAAGMLVKNATRRYMQAMQPSLTFNSRNSKVMGLVP